MVLKPLSVGIDVRVFQSFCAQAVKWTYHIQIISESFQQSKQLIDYPDDITEEELDDDDDNETIQTTPTTNPVPPSPPSRQGTSVWIRSNKQSVQCSSELLIIVIEDEVKLCYPFLHDVKETDRCEAISPMFKRAALLLNWRWSQIMLSFLTWRQRKLIHVRQSVQCSSELIYC